MLLYVGQPIELGLFRRRCHLEPINWPCESARREWHDSPFATPSPSTNSEYCLAWCSQVSGFVIEGGRLKLPKHDKLPGDAGDGEQFAAYVTLMQKCWEQDPRSRPSFADVFRSGARKCRCIGVLPVPFFGHKATPGCPRVCLQGAVGAGCCPGY